MAKLRNLFVLTCAAWLFIAGVYCLGKGRAAERYIQEKIRVERLLVATSANPIPPLAKNGDRSEAVEDAQRQQNRGIVLTLLGGSILLVLCVRFFVLPTRRVQRRACTPGLAKSETVVMSHGSTQRLPVS